MLIGHTPLVLKRLLPLRISRLIPCLPCEAILQGLSILVRRSKSFFYLCHTHIESLYKAFVGWVLDVSSGPKCLTLWGHTIQCVCACPSGLFSGAVFISFYVFPHFFTSLFCLSVPSYPTARVRGNRRLLRFACQDSQHNSPMGCLSRCCPWLLFVGHTLRWFLQFVLLLVFCTLFISLRVQSPHR